MLSSLRAYVGRHHIGLLALFIALGGTSYAAIKLPANSVGAKQLKKGAVTPKKVARSTRALFKGQKGSRGPTGARGATGASGTPGSPAGSAVLGAAFDDAALYYAAPSGVVHGGTELFTDVEVSPNTTLVARDLFVSTDTAPGGVESRAVTFRVNHVDTALKCTMTGAAKSCDSGTATVNVPPGSIISMKLEKSGGATMGYVYWGFRLTTP